MLVDMFVQPIIKTLKTNKIFFITYSLLLIVGLYPLLKWDQVTIALFINAHHHPWMDTFFYYVTYLGDGIIYGLLMLVLFFVRTPYKQLMVGIGSFCTMSVVVQFLKRIIFHHHLRPISVVPLTTPLDQIHLVDEVDVLTHLSFPSGHTATIFTAVCFLSLLYGYLHQKKATNASVEKEKTLLASERAVGRWGRFSIGLTCITLVLLRIALFVAYSRMYLFQHFYKDVYVGALIGGWTTCLVYAVWIHSKLPQWLISKLPPRLAHWAAITLRE
eukprot:gene1027-1302_t